MSDASNQPSGSVADAPSRGRRERRSSLSIMLAVVAALTSAAGVLLATFDVMKPLTGFTLVNMAAALGVVLVIVGAVQAVRGQVRVGLVAMLIAALPATPGVLMGVKATQYPPINDYSTDLDNPPAFVHAPTLPGNEQSGGMAFPPEFADVVRQSAPDLQPARFAMAPGDVVSRVLEELDQHGLDVTRTDRNNPDQMEVEAVAQTSLFHFRDDVIVRVRAADDGGSIVDIRSRSRVGNSDLGANANRIRALLAGLRQRIGGDGGAVNQ